MTDTLRHLAEFNDGYLKQRHDVLLNHCSVMTVTTQQNLPNGAAPPTNTAQAKNSGDVAYSGLNMPWVIPYTSAPVAGDQIVVLHTENGHFILGKLSG